MSMPEKNSVPIYLQRENIQAGALRAYFMGLPETDPQDPLLQDNLSSTQVSELWQRHSQEAFEIAAALSTRVMERMVVEGRKCPPYNLFTMGTASVFEPAPLTDFKNFNDLRHGLKASLDFAYGLYSYETERKIRDGENTIETATLKRFIVLYTFAKKYLDQSVGDATLDISAGINTAGYRMMWALELIMERFQLQFPEEPLTIDTFVQTARNSWGYIAFNSALHRHKLLQTSVGTGAHVLVPTKNGLRLEYVLEEKTRIEVEAKNKELADRDNRPNFGCPALANIHGDSVIKQLWDLQISNTERMYQTHYSGESVFRLKD